MTNTARPFGHFAAENSCAAKISFVYVLGAPTGSGGVPDEVDLIRVLAVDVDLGRHAPDRIPARQARGTRRVHPRDSSRHPPLTSDRRTPLAHQECQPPPLLLPSSSRYAMRCTMTSQMTESQARTASPNGRGKGPGGQTPGPFRDAQESQRVPRLSPPLKAR
jgi:hypothetical protein